MSFDNILIDGNARKNPFIDDSSLITANINRYVNIALPYLLLFSPARSIVSIGLVAYQIKKFADNEGNLDATQILATAKVLGTTILGLASPQMIQDKWAYTFQNRSTEPGVTGVLDLSKQDLTDNELRELLKKYPDITVLNIRKCPNITSKGLEEVQKLKNLETLYLSENVNLSESSLNLLTKLPLKHLFIRKNAQFGSEVAKTIYSIETLETLVAGRCWIHDDAMEDLANMENLKELDIHKNPLTDEGMISLSESRSIEKLKIRGIENITIEGFFALFKMPQLKELNIRGCKITEEQLTVLQHQRLNDNLPPITVVTEKSDTA